MRNPSNGGADVLILPAAGVSIRGLCRSYAGCRLQSTAKPIQRATNPGYTCLLYTSPRKSQAFPPGFCSLNISQTECKQKASNVKFCKLLTSEKPRFPHCYAGFNLSKIFFSKPRRVSLWPIAATSRRLPRSVPSSCRLYSGGAGLCAGPLSVRF